MSIKEANYCSLDCYKLVNWKIMSEPAGAAMRTEMPAWHG